MRLLRHIVCAAVLAFPALLHAQQRVGLGIEWGLGFHPLHYQAESFRSDAGFRMDRSGWDASRHVNGFAGIALEWDVSGRETLSLTLSGRGVGNGNRILPVGLRYARFRNGHSADTGWWLAEAGIGYNLDAQVHTAFQGLVGRGWRYRLGAHSFVDGGLRLALVGYRADIIDPDTDGTVPDRDVYRNGRLDLFAEFFLAIRLR